MVSKKCNAGRTIGINGGGVCGVFVGHLRATDEHWNKSASCGTSIRCMEEVVTRYVSVS